MQPLQAKPITAALVAVSLLAATGCGPSMKTLDRLAGTGAIDASAPVSAHVEIEINAPAPRVWALLVNAAQWPQWDADISNVSATQPLQAGKRFTWSTGNSTVHSEVQLLEPNHRLAWAGTAFTAKAVHVWELSPEPGGRTRVTIHESMDGPLMAVIFPSKQLDEAGRAWLGYLKQAAEKP